MRANRAESVAAKSSESRAAGKAASRLRTADGSGEVGAAVGWRIAAIVGQAAGLSRCRQFLILMGADNWATCAHFWPARRSNAARCGL